MKLCLFACAVILAAMPASAQDAGKGITLIHGQPIHQEAANEAGVTMGFSVADEQPYFAGLLSDLGAGIPAAWAGEQQNTCEEFGWEPVLHADRIWLKEFSVVPPTGDDWCTGGPEASSIVIRKNTLNGKTEDEITFEDRAHTFYVFAELYGAGEHDDQRIVSHRISAGQRCSGCSQRRRVMLPLSTVSRSLLVASGAWRDDSLGLECVHYIQHFDESGSRLFPDKVLRIEHRSYVCVSPNLKGDLIHIGYSERFAKDRPPDPPLMEFLKPQADAFTSSIWLPAPEGADVMESYRRAAEKGYSQAQFSLAVALEANEEYGEALGWYRAAAGKGHSGAAEKVADFVQRGLGARSD
jgi:hypothetical protein